MKVITIIVPFSAGGPTDTVTRLRAQSMGKPLPRMAMAGRIAEAVVRAARDEGLGLPRSDDAIPTAVEAARWEPPLPDRA